jgi:hypothetical protein
MAKKRRLKQDKQVIREIFGAAVVRELDKVVSETDNPCRPSPPPKPKRKS